MQKCLRQCIRGLFLALLCVPLAFADHPAATQATVGEPPLEYVLNIDGTVVPITPDQPTSVKIGDRELQLRLTPKAERLLKLPGLSITYPSYYTYQTDQSNLLATQWVVQGRDTTLIITSANAAGVNANSLETLAISQLAAKSGEKDLKRTSTDISFAGKKVAATRFDFSIDNAKLYQILFAVPTGGATYLIIIQDVPTKNGATSGEMTALLGLLNKAVVSN